MESSIVMEILAVDSSLTVIGMITAVLERLGHHVTPAENGAAGLQIVRGLRYDAVITELHLPGMSGLELIKSIRRVDNTIPIVVLSSIESIDMVVEAMREGADDYVRKSAEDLGKTLPAVVERCVGNKKRQRRLQVYDAILPVCAYCKKVRYLQDKEYVWVSMEQYFNEKKSGIDFSHGICSECLKKFSTGDKYSSS